MPSPHCASSCQDRDPEEGDPLWLPPMDADEDAPEGSETPGEDLLVPWENCGPGDELGVEGDAAEDMIPFVDEPGDLGAPDNPIDVGDLAEDLHFDDSPRDVQDFAEQAADDLDLDSGILAGGDDGGVEGTSENPEDEVDERCLPAMDDDGAEPDDDLADDLLSQASEGSSAPDSLRPMRWARIDGLGACVPCLDVCAAQGCVAAAGEVAMLVEEGARTARGLSFGEHATAAVLAFGGVVVASTRGDLLVGQDGHEPRRVASFQAELSPSLSSDLRDGRSGRGDCSMALAVTHGRCWVRVGDALYYLLSPDRALLSLRDHGVIAIASCEQGLVVLVKTAASEGPPGSDATISIERFRSDDEGLTGHPLPSAVVRMLESFSEDPLLAVSVDGNSVAVSAGERLAVSSDGGASFRVLEVSAPVALAFAGDSAEPRLLALVPPLSTGAPAPRLLEIPSDEDPVVLADLPSSPLEDLSDSAMSKPLLSVRPPAWGRSAMAWDSTREVLWIACQLGLLALGPTKRH